MSSAQFLFANNATSTLAGALTTGSTSLSVQTGDGAKFPSPGANQWFAITLISASNPTVNEIVYCTARSTDTLTIVRARESTTAKSWNVLDQVKMLPTAGMMQALWQANVMAPDYAADSGSANAYAGTYSPAVPALIDGLKLRLKIANTNTAASTFAPNGLTAHNILNAATGAALVGGELQAGMEVELTYSATGTAWWFTSKSSAIANRAWAVFTFSAGTVTVHQSYNIDPSTGINRTATGKFTATFTNALNTSWPTASGMGGNATDNLGFFPQPAGTISSTQFDFQTVQVSTGTTADPSFYYCVNFGGATP